MCMHVRSREKVRVHASCGAAGPGRHAARGMPAPGPADAGMVGGCRRGYTGPLQDHEKIRLLLVSVSFHGPAQLHGSVACLGRSSDAQKQVRPPSARPP